jgi:LCP family protein required for cell wall assembly
MKIARYAGLALVFALAALGGYVAFMGQKHHQTPVEVVTRLFVEPPQQHFRKDRITVLVMGIDYDYDSKDQEFSSSARSDTIMAVSVNFPTDVNPKPSLAILSVPRDIYAPITPSEHKDKINVAYALGGPQRAEEAVAAFLGLPGFDRYVTLRINATKDLIDAVGGLDVVPDENMDYDDSWGHLHIHFKGGQKYHMTGEQAVSYSRFRHDACGDPCRIRRQQQVVALAVDKIKRNGFNDLTHIPQLIGIVRKDVYTDFSFDEMKSIAASFSQIDLASIKKDQVPFTDAIDTACCGNVLLADENAKDKIVQKLFLDPILPPAAPADPAAVAAVDPKSVSVTVRNGSGEPGAGSKMAALLKAKGFAVASIANADSFGYDTTEIHVHSAKTPLAGESLRAVALPKATVAGDQEPAEDADSDVTVIVGKDFVTALHAEASAAK